MAWWRPDRKISNDLRKLVDIKDLVQLLLTINHTQSTMDSLKQGVAAGAAAFREDGAVGSAFKSDGALGGTAQAIGGPFDKQGAIGQQFTTEGAVGGNVQATAEKVSGEAAASSSDPSVAHRPAEVTSGEPQKYA